MFDNFTLADSYDSYGGKKAIVAYTKCTGRQTLQERLELQKRMDLTPELCLSDNFDTCGICKDMRWSYHDGGLWPSKLGTSILLSYIASYLVCSLHFVIISIISTSRL